MSIICLPLMDIINHKLYKKEHLYYMFLLYIFCLKYSIFHWAFLATHHLLVGKMYPNDLWFFIFINSITLSLYRDSLIYVYVTNSFSGSMDIYSLKGIMALHIYYWICIKHKKKESMWHEQKMSFEIFVCLTHPTNIFYRLAIKSVSNFFHKFASNFIGTTVSNTNLII